MLFRSFHANRVIDLSYTAALRLGVLGGVAPVEVVRITHDEIRAGLWKRGPRDVRNDVPLQPQPVLPVTAAADDDPPAEIEPDLPSPESAALAEVLDGRLGERIGFERCCRLCSSLCKPTFICRASWSRRISDGAFHLALTFVDDCID